MRSLYKRSLVVLVCLLLIGSILPAVITLPLPTDDYETTTLTISDCGASNTNTFTVDIAETSVQQYVGLSKREELQSGQGMLFPYDSMEERSFVMRNMDFSLAIVFIGEDKTVTDVKIAEAPAGPIEYYISYGSVKGTGMYVLELPAEDAEKVSVGSCVTWD